MPMPRLTIRRLMVAVAIVALLLGSVAAMRDAARSARLVEAALRGVQLAPAPIPTTWPKPE
jgi:hypothetical protein